MTYAVCVTFTVQLEHREAFVEKIRANAAASLGGEPGCLRFDVCSDGDNADEIFLYELYDSPGSFDTHLKSEHFTRFNEETSGMVTAKSVRTYRSVT